LILSTLFTLLSLRSYLRIGVNLSYNYYVDLLSLWTWHGCSTSCHFGMLVAFQIDSFICFGLSTLSFFSFLLSNRLLVICSWNRLYPDFWQRFIWFLIVSGWTCFCYQPLRTCVCYTLCWSYWSFRFWLDASLGQTFVFYRGL